MKKSNVFQRNKNVQKQVQNNGTAGSPMQFKVPEAIAKDQRVHPKQVFVGYSKKKITTHKQRR